MPAKKPKDLMLAEVAYNTFYQEQPQVFFDDLHHDYQMRWVRAIRSVVSDYRRLQAPVGGDGGGQKTVPVRSHKKKEKPAKRSGTNGVSPGINPARLKQWEDADKEDLALFTDTNWNNKTKKEIQARQRLAYRNKQREKYGLDVTQHASL